MMGAYTQRLLQENLRMVEIVFGTESTVKGTESTVQGTESTVQI